MSQLVRLEGKHTTQSAHCALYPSTVPSEGDHPVEPGWWESCPHGGALVSQDILLLQRFQSSFSLWKKINFPILLQFLKQSSWPGYVERRQSSWKGWRWTRWLFFFKYIFFHLRTSGGRYLHNDPEEVLGRPDDSKTKELPFHLLVQPALHGRLVHRDWERGNSGAFVNFPLLPPLVFSSDFS